MLSKIASDSNILRYIKSLQIPALKNLGQNFLISQDVLSSIVGASGDLSQKHVIEIGPGPCTLTSCIAERSPKRLTLIEFDRRFESVIKKIGADELIFDDVLNVNLTPFFDDNTVIISNLPYNISVKLLYKLLSDIEKFDFFVFMFQKEVADRILATPNTKDYGKLSVLMQIFCQIERIIDVPPEAFRPAPSVSSTVLKITPVHLGPSISSINRGAFNQMLTKLFENRRKKLKKKLERFINCSGDFVSGMYDLRAEDISPSDYVLLYHELTKMGNI